MHKSISPERDEINKKLIAYQLFRIGSCAEQTRLLTDATPEERAAYIWKCNKLLLLCIAAVVAYFLITSLIPRDPPQPLPAPEISISAAGQVQSLQLHETAFSRSTTVVTSMGIYQVQGGVSAASGDVATLKRAKKPFAGSYMIELSLCIESKIKTRCYDIL